MNKKIIFSLSLIVLIFIAWLMYTKSITTNVGDTTNHSLESTETVKIIKPFDKYVPKIIDKNLELVEIDRRSPGKKYREVDIFNLETMDGEKETKKISTEDGYRAMYSYPDTDYFANVKIEKSVAGQYENDKKIALEYIKHLFDRKMMSVKDYTEKNPETKKELAEKLATGKDYLSFENETYNGYNYVSYTENVIGLTENTISQVHIFVPEDEIIITTYLLNQENPNFKTIDEFLEIRKNFITGYIDDIVSKK